jgi:hypothetical protein
MATFNKFNLTVDDLAKALDNLSTDSLKVILTNTTPVATWHSYPADVSGELSTANGYTSGGATVPSTGATNSSGTETVAGSSVTWTASGGNVGPFEYVVLFDSTSGKLLGWWDYVSAITLNGTNGDSFTWAPTGNVLFTIS